MLNIIQFLLDLFKKISKKESSIIPEGTNMPPILPPAIIPPAIIPVGKKRALCFGINNYGGPNNLRGCLNDIADWSKLLKDVYKFDEVATMTDSQCTIENIMKAMQDIIEKSNSGDVVALQYSGHGTYTADKNFDEEDGKDECI